MGARSIPLQAWIESTLFIRSKRETARISILAPPGKAKQTTIVMAFKTMGRMPTPSWVPFGCCTRRGALSEVSHEFSLCHSEFRPGDFL